MLEFKRGEWNRCTLIVDNLRASKTRKALIFYFRDLGLPISAARYVMRKSLDAKGTGVRVYRLTSTHYIYVNYGEGFFFTGTEDQVIDKVAERYPWQQGVLWIEQAFNAAWGKKMSRNDIDLFIYDFEIDLNGVKLMMKNVAPIEKRRKRRRRHWKKTRKELRRVYGYEDL